MFYYHQHHKNNINHENFPRKKCFVKEKFYIDQFAKKISSIIINNYQSQTTYFYKIDF